MALVRNKQVLLFLIQCYLVPSSLLSFGGFNVQKKPPACNFSFFGGNEVWGGGERQEGDDAHVLFFFSLVTLFFSSKKRNTYLIVCVLFYKTGWVFLDRVFSSLSYYCAWWGKKADEGLLFLLMVFLGRLLLFGIKKNTAMDNPDSVLELIAGASTVPQTKTDKKKTGKKKRGKKRRRTAPVEDIDIELEALLGARPPKKKQGKNKRAHALIAIAWWWLHFFFFLTPSHNHLSPWHSLFWKKTGGFFFAFLALCFRVSRVFLERKKGEVEKKM